MRRISHADAIHTAYRFQGNGGLGLAEMQEAYNAVSEDAKELISMIEGHHKRLVVLRQGCRHSLEELKDEIHGILEDLTENMNIDTYKKDQISDQTLARERDVHRKEMDQVMLELDLTLTLTLTLTLKRWIRSCWSWT